MLYTALLFALAVVATYPLLFHAADQLSGFYDQLDSSWRIWASLYHLPHDPLNLFQAPIFYPYHNTLLFDELIFGEALLAAPVMLLTDNAFLSFNLVVIATFVIAGWGAYLLAFHVTAHRPAAIAAGLLYSFSAYHFTHIGHIGLGNIGYLPLLLLALDKLLRSGGKSVGWAVALAALIAMQALSAEYYFFYMILMLGLYLLYAITRSETRGFFTRRFIVRLLATVLAGLLPALPFYLTYMQVQNAYRFRVPDQDVYMLSANLRSLFAAPSSAPWLHSFLHSFDGTYFSNYEIGIFPGFAPLLLAAVGGGLWLRRRYSTGRFYVPFFLLLGSVSLVLSLGPYLQLDYNYVPNSMTGLPLPYLLLYRFVPGFSALHGVARITVLASLALSMLGAFAVAGIGDLLSPYHNPAKPQAQPAELKVGITTRYALKGLPLLMVGFALFEQFSPPTELVPAPLGSAVPAVYRWLAAAPPGAVLELPLEYTDKSVVAQVRGLKNAEMLNQYQYFTSVHHHPIVNGPGGSLNPSGYEKLIQDLPGNFPSGEMMDMMRGLGVRYTIFHLTKMGAKQREHLFRQRRRLASLLIWRAGFDVVGKSLTEETSQGRTKGDLVYEIMPIPTSVLGLRDYVPPGSHVYFSDYNDKGRTGYMGVAEYVLAEAGCAIYGYSMANFGVSVQGPLTNKKYDYIVLYKDERPTAFPTAHRIWGNDTITLYRLDPFPQTR